MNRSTAAGSFFLPVISVITEISDRRERMSRGVRNHAARKSPARGGAWILREAPYRLSAACRPRSLRESNHNQRLFRKRRQDPHPPQVPDAVDHGEVGFVGFLALARRQII